MAKAYQVKTDVTFPRVIAKIDRPGQEPLYETEGVNYAAGSYILEDNMTPRDRERADNGELEDILGDPVDADPTHHPHRAGEPEFGIFVAEHEAEAHALEQYGHHVLPHEQVLDAMSAGAEQARDYQEFAREHGIDHRPAQTALSQPRERLPEEVLHGGETRSGAPYSTVPPESSPRESESVRESEERAESADDASAPAPRPRPGSETGEEPGGSEEV